MRIVLGISAFALFFLNDYNDWKWGFRALKFCFPLGGILLAVATVLGAFWGTPPVSGWPVLAAAVLAVLFLLLLIYTLLFALPVGAAYTQQGESRPLVATGIYALCRHPGVLWFAGLYFSLWLCTGFSLGEALLYSGLNVFLVIFEDRWVFPGKLAGYDAYQRVTPFLLPNRQSLWACRETLRGEHPHAI